MYGVISDVTGKLLSRHRNYTYACVARDFNMPATIVYLMPITGRRGMIGHTWPWIGKKISASDVRPWDRSKLEVLGKAEAGKGSDTE